MKIGRYRFKPRFLVLLTLLIIVFVVAVKLLTPKPPPPPPNKLAIPAFPTTQLVGLKPGWLGPYISNFQLQQLDNPGWYRSDYPQLVGLPMVLHVYLPDASTLDQSFAPYSFVLDGWTFRPVVIIPADQPLSQTSGMQVSPSSNNFAVIGFPSDSVPVGGQFYSLNTLLYYRSDRLAPPSVQSSGAAPAPVFLADCGPASANDNCPWVKELSQPELRAPATQVYPLDLRFQESGEEVDIDRVEWAAGQEVRVWVTLKNLSGTAAVPVWAGAQGQNLSAQLPGEAPVGGQVDSASALAQLQGQLPAGGPPISGDLVFPAPVADPTKTLTITLPGLNQNDPNEQIRFTLQDPQSVGGPTSAAVAIVQGSEGTS